MIFVSDKKKSSYGNKTYNLKIPDGAINPHISGRHGNASTARGGIAVGRMAIKTQMHF